jgi:hypothetical protein
LAVISDGLSICQVASKVARRLVFELANPRVAPVPSESAAYRESRLGIRRPGSTTRPR